MKDLYSTGLLLLSHIH